MQKKFRIAILLTVILLLIWVIAGLTFVTIHPDKIHEMPLFLSASIISILGLWLLAGLILLFKYFKTVQAEIIKFINSKN